MPTTSAINQLLLLVGFTGFSFILLRLTFQYAAEGKIVLAVPPALTAFGALSALVLLRLKLADYLVWHLLFLAMIFVAWWRKTRLDGERLDALARDAAAQTGAKAADISGRFLAARQLLTLGFACYVIAFLAAFLYLVPRN